MSLSIWRKNVFDLNVKSVFNFFMLIIVTLRTYPDKKPNRRTLRQNDRVISTSLAGWIKIPNLKYGYENSTNAYSRIIPLSNTPHLSVFYAC